MRRKYPVARKIMLTMMMMNKDEGGIPYNAGNKDSPSKNVCDMQSLRLVV
jgi:uncharacterized protein (DUF608 family)